MLHRITAVGIPDPQPATSTRVYGKAVFLVYLDD